MKSQADRIRRLAELVGVTAPERRSFDWAAVEAVLGVQLPSDYKLLAEWFPEGFVREFVRILLPEVWPDGRARFPDEFALGVVESMRRCRDGGEEYGGEYPYPLFPEPGGLLPWGWIGTPGVAFWLTGPGDPDTWPVVVATEEADYWERVGGTMSEFLLEVAECRYDASNFSDGPVMYVEEAKILEHPMDLSEHPVFTPGPPARKRPPRGPRAGYWLNRLTDDDLDHLPVDDLTAVRQVAGPPPGVTPVDWPAVHKRLGFALPADYRAFIDTYGLGVFGDIQITAPGAPGQMELFTLLDRINDQVRDLPRYASDPPFYPEPGGAICCGQTIGGWLIAWAPVRNDLDEWTVAAIRPSPTLAAASFRPDLSFTTLLKLHAQQKPGMRGGLLPPREPAEGPVVFTPYASS